MLITAVRTFLSGGMHLFGSTAVRARHARRRDRPVLHPVQDPVLVVDRGQGRLGPLVPRRAGPCLRRGEDLRHGRRQDRRVRQGRRRAAADRRRGGGGTVAARRRIRRGPLSRASRPRRRWSASGSRRPMTPSAPARPAGRGCRRRRRSSCSPHRRTPPTTPPSPRRTRDRPCPIQLRTHARHAITPRRGQRPGSAPQFQAAGGPRRRGAAPPPARPIRVASVPPQLRFQPPLRPAATGATAQARIRTCRAGVPAGAARAPHR